MRPELQLIEQIEQYLNGQLSTADKTAFEQRMSGDPALQEEVRLQREIMRGIERAVIRQQIHGAKTSFHMQQNFMRWGLGIAIVLVIAVLAYFYIQRTTPALAYDGLVLPEYNEQGEKQWADADRNIAAQTFIIDASKDTVIETKDGIVMAVPANGFLDEHNTPVTGTVQLVVKEALDRNSIIKAGLSSKSGDELLESGGMFFIDARKDQKPVKIDPSKGIYAEIPANGIKQGMQLFNGNRKPDGTIDWLNPKPLEHDLITVSMQSLNFYPPTYLDSLRRWGYDIKNKAFTDSLYYSFARLFAQLSVVMPESKIFYEQSESDSISVIPKDTAIKTDRLTDNGLLCGINPAKIKTIWTKEFGNTILATREFEQRLLYIHILGNNDILDLYVNNLDKNLSFIDSLAALQYGKPYDDQINPFLEFAKRRDGKVSKGNSAFPLLRKYYEGKTKAFTEAIAKTQNEFWSKHAELDNNAANRNAEYFRDSVNRARQNFMEEFMINVKDAYRQLGYDTSITPWINNSVYRTQVTSTGWNNVDKYVYESTVARNTFNYTDSITGKKAVINYLPVSIQVAEWNDYDRLYVYLLPDKLSSFMRLSGTEGKYTEKLDELISYGLVCIGYKDEQAYFYSQESVQSKEYAGIALTAIGKDELEQQLKITGGSAKALSLSKQMDYFRLQSIDLKRQEKITALEELTYKVQAVIFPCYSNMSK